MGLQKSVSSLEQLNGIFELHQKKSNERLHDFHKHFFFI